jgi:thioesterase domain-containing protein
VVGWSFGGLAAHAVATELQRRGRDVALLAVLDVAPGWHDLSHEGVPGSGDEEMRQHLEYLLRLVDVDPDILDDEEFAFDNVMSILRSRGSAMGALDVDHLRAIMAVFTNNTHLMIDYRPAVFDGDILLLATTDQQDPASTAAAWSGHLTGEVRTELITGDHGTMLTRPTSLSQVGVALATALDDVRSRPEEMSL